jgi:YD repeat-containing protein
MKKADCLKHKQVPQLAEVAYAYDDQGRLVQITQGSGEQARVMTVAYNQAGELEKITDPLKQEVKFEYDAVGRVLTQTFADGRLIGFEYDTNGNVTRLTPPSRPAHLFDYNAVDLPIDYSPPLLPTVPQPHTQYLWNLDKQLTQLIRPDGQTISFDYDATQGRLKSIHFPEGTQTLTYDDQGRIASVTAVDGNQLSYSYDGSLVLSETWEGLIQGKLQLTYNNDFQVRAVSVNNNNVNYQYDNDGLLTKAGELTFTRNSQNGLLTGTQLGKLTTQASYNPFSELQAETASFNNTPLYQVHYDRDPAGRLVQKTETVEGVTHTFKYSYDLANRLAEVKQDGIVTETYQYDANGNRLNHQAVYDDQDRLLQYGSNTYTYTDNGELLTKNDIRYHYDVVGNLRQVQWPAKTLDYVIDARNRRIGKKVNGQLVQRFLWENQLRIAAELDAVGNVVSRFIYGTKANVPELILKDGITYRVITDHLGSPRLIVDTSTGVVAQRMDYDEWGNVLYDSNPGFQPFGFAGRIV